MKWSSSLRTASLCAALAFPIAVAAQTQTVHYLFNGNANDVSGNSLDGTLHGSATINATELIIPDDDSSRMDVPAVAADALQDISVDATVTFDVLHTTGADPMNTVMSGARAGQDNILFIAYSENSQEWRVGINNSMVTFPFNAAPNIRYHITMIRNGGDIDFYVDGTQIGVTEHAPNASLQVDPGLFVLGQHQPTVGTFVADQSLAGRIGDLTIWDGAISPPVPPITWTGAIDDDWFKPGNWNLNRIPVASDSAIVPAPPPNQPLITGGTGVSGSLTLEPGSALNEFFDGTLDLQKHLINTSTSSSFSGTTIFSGAGAHELQGESTSFSNLTVGSGGLTDLSDGIRISRLLWLDGNLMVGSTPLVIESNSDATGMVVNNGGVVNGTVTVQRYISSGNNPGVGYRHVSSPVTSAPLNDWNTSFFTVVTNTEYNTHPLPSNFPNTFYFDETKATAADFTKGYKSPASPASPMQVGRGYSMRMPPSIQESADVSGTLNNGTLAAPTMTRTGNHANSGWNLLGNPYAAPIDWDQVTIPAGMSPSVSVFQSNGTFTGTYMTYNNGVGSLPGGLIPMMHGFFVRVLAPNTSLPFQFTNAMRSTVYENPTFTRQAPDSRPLVTLAVTSARDGVTDEAFIYFEQGATAGYDPYFDAAKVSRSLETAPTLSVLAGQEELAIQGMAPEALNACTVLPLRVLVNVAGTHTLTAAQLRNLPAGQPLWLTDAVGGTVVDLTQLPDGYAFDQTPSFAGARFTLQIGGQKPAVNPLCSTLTLDAYPNPVSSGTLRLALTGLAPAAKAVKAALLDQLGRVVRQAELPVQGGAVSHELPTAGLPTGPYVLRLTVAETGEAVSQTIVVQ